jgi:hypothetical protein
MKSSDTSPIIRAPAKTTGTQPGQFFSLQLEPTIMTDYFATGATGR